MPLISVAVAADLQGFVQHPQLAQALEYFLGHALGQIEHAVGVEGSLYAFGINPTLGPRRRPLWRSVKRF